MSDLIIIQARLSSTRLPGKVLLPFYKGKTLLDLQVEQLMELGHSFVIATSTNPADDRIETWAKDNGVQLFRGDELNVLKRFVDCANQYEAENLIRVCSDNPFLFLKKVDSYFAQLKSGIEYISYCNEQRVPAIKTHWGLFPEGVSRKALEKAMDCIEGLDQANFYSEHVTNYIYGNPKQFNVLLKNAPQEVFQRNDLRYTIDTNEDFINMQKLFSRIPDWDGMTRLNDLVDLSDSDKDMKIVMQRSIEKFTK